MPKIEFDVERVTVVINDGADHVIVHCKNFPSSIPKVCDDPLDFTFRAEYDTGAEYVRKNFKIEPEITGVRHSRRTA